MFKKIILSCAVAAVLGSAFSTSVFADESNVAKQPPIHWSKHPFSNADNTFKNGKAFCRKKYFGRKVCIPAMNNTVDALVFNTSDYSNGNVPSSDVLALMGKGSLPTVIFTVQDGGKTVYSGPANNREGVICTADKVTNAVTCAAWK